MPHLTQWNIKKGIGYLLMSASVKLSILIAHCHEMQLNFFLISLVASFFKQTNAHVTNGSQCIKKMFTIERLVPI